LNVKLGGINTVPDPTSVTPLTDPNMPTVVMGEYTLTKMADSIPQFVIGADVIHPSPGSEGRPSFTSLVGNVDSDTAKYVAGSHEYLKFIQVL
jgi:eukaryotic translation initiation factor 2C